MVWRWWWQRRRRPWRRPRRRRWRRIRARRPRRPVRRRARRRTVRRRRWAKRRGRRRRPVRRRRRRRVRNFKKKLVLTQWHPAVIRRCLIRGIAPIVLCGHGTWNSNYALHSEDYPEQGRYPFGGSFSTTTWSLKVLYDEHLKKHNWWGYPNTQLDLGRYRGCKLTFYRHKKTDYIVTWSRKPPFKLNKYSCPLGHPGMLMLSKYKLLVPSFDTRPGGRAKISVRIRPPTLLEDKWYTQQDLCSVNLMQLTVSAANFQHPFSSPLTNTTTTTFQVLKDIYTYAIGIVDTGDTKYGAESKSYQEYVKQLEQKLTHNASYWNSFHTEEYLNPNITSHKNKKLSEKFSPQNLTTLKTGDSTRFGYNSYNTKSLHNEIIAARDWYFTELNKPNDTSVKFGQATAKHLEYHLGVFSPIFLSIHRSNINFARAYQDVTYNPNCDRGQGNRVWFQPSTKPDTIFDEKRCKVVLEHLPLWALFHCYADFVEEEMGWGSEVQNSGLVVCQCPYTFPPMYDKNNKDKGYVFYDTMFGSGKMPDGRGQIDPFWQVRWYPRMGFQKQVMADITKTGPFSYKDDLVMTDFNMKYKFDFMWGGDMISEQIIKNPCRESGMEPTYPDRQRRDIQVVDPHTMGPQFSFHTWDYRRGLFSKDSIKRMCQQQITDTDFVNPFKKPRFLVPTERFAPGQEEDSDSQSQRTGSSLQESDQEAPEKKIQELQPLQQQQLHLQLAEQQRLGQQLRWLVHQMLKTQANLHLNPYTFIQR
uniref:Capsid protein n=1 Tax=Alphatorquevirus homin21 TaxID=3048423 RepID=A0AAU7SSC6_9VIRU